MSSQEIEKLAAIDGDYQLDDRYSLESGRIYLTGSQALVRLPMMQRRRDLAEGLNTAGFISGYEGSPLGGYDLSLKQAAAHLRKHQIHFQPGLNEEMGATAVAGSQQSGLMAGAKYDGVFGIWYGKGPGVDRAADALKHGSYGGAASHGGVLVLAGDDHGAKSSTTAHQSDQAFIHFGMPYLNPATVQDYLDFGLYGFALSRFSGCWVGMKCVTDTIESSASVVIDPEQICIRLPQDVTLPQGGLHIRWGMMPILVETLQYQQRLPAVQAFVRANALDRVIRESPIRRLGIVTSGKAYLDVMQALDELGLDEHGCREKGVSVYKVAMPWPLEPVNALAFAAGQEELLLVEEKRAVIEDQLAKLLYHLPQRPRLVGKFDEFHKPVLSAEGELSSTLVAIAIGKRLLRMQSDPVIEQRVCALELFLLPQGVGASGLRRLPAFCAGCPHNTSTNIPEGSLAFGGIGCHGMATFLPERRTLTVNQMGGEGASWIGIAPFTSTPHIFQNLGDGTYFHSGILAIRATVAAGVNITYKILVNDAVAMTGGQQIEGQVRVDALTRQLHAEGVGRIVVLTNDLSQYTKHAVFAEGVTLHHRDKLDAVQRELRECHGVSVMVYDQTCATELRRRRKRGKAPDPDQRTFINEAVCEGCGDCSVQSNCIAVEPVETELGRKRKINQSACNKDFSCLKGYCPSFVTVYGGKLRSQNTSKAVGESASAKQLQSLPTPPVVSATLPYSILITGIGGSGVVTVGALLGVAAHLEGKGCSVLDVAGLAQRNGPVTSHVRIAADPAALHSTRIGTRGAQLILGTDIVVTAGLDALSKVRAGHTRILVNSHVAPTFEFATNPNLDLAPEQMMRAIAQAAGEDQVQFVAATPLASALMGNAVASNLFMVGYALQLGLLPVSLAALERAIELNGVEVQMNKSSLNWGRQAAHDLPYVEQVAKPDINISFVSAPETLSSLINSRAATLTQYQNAAYALRYRLLVDRVAAAEVAAVGHRGILAETVARYYFKLLAYKDEYEVARLFADPKFRQRLEEQFEGDFKIEFNLAPPLFQTRNALTGRYPKQKFGSWMQHGFFLIAKLKFLRGTVFDFFGYAAHRRSERELILVYERTIAELIAILTQDNLALAVEIASLPEQIRGYDTVKDSSILKTRSREVELMLAYRSQRTVTKTETSVLV
ncbi:MAG: indolepyruvate ferredoxin oxidoreductase family protein [Gammaproteobacteria bacterium]|nr:indolepyruvate ferredoxin oxidoreductase family protein [Gammaproteobacteria bacterium]